MAALLTPEQETKVGRYLEAWQAADTPRKRAWLVHQAAERGESILCDIALMRSTYPGAIAPAPTPERKPTVCPTCGAPAPHLHPQKDGEMEPCRDRFHLTVTPLNTLDRIAKAQAALIEQTKREFLARGEADPEELETAEEAQMRIRAEDMMGGLTG